MLKTCTRRDLFKIKVNLERRFYIQNELLATTNLSSVVYQKYK